MWNNADEKAISNEILQQSNEFLVFLGLIKHWSAGIVEVK